MSELLKVIHHDPSRAWLLLPTAVLLGALHALEPGHSKTMMAAFIIAIRGTVWQAVLLGLSAAFSHSLLIWVLVLFGLHYDMNKAGDAEPFLLLCSAVLVFGLAAWMFIRVRRELREEASHQGGHDEHLPEHHHSHAHDHDHIHPHEHQDSEEYEDAHERTHAEEIRRRFAGKAVTTPQIVLFGITGGLMPCPAAFVVLVVCLQLKRAILGLAMVAAFSLGLAVTMVCIGAAAAIGAHQAQKHFHGLGRYMRRAPYISCALLVALGIYMAWNGWHGLR
jgi:nickel/cobalt transporter (NicO) family protein